MTDIPTAQNLYDEARADLEGDTQHQFVNFNAGSWLDAFTAVVAVTGAAVLRYVVKRIVASYISSATGADLDARILDLFPELTRHAGESDFDYRARALDKLEHLGLGTWTALLLYARNNAGVASAEQGEVSLTGNLTIYVTIADGFTAATVLEELHTGVAEVAAAGISVNFVEV